MLDWVPLGGTRRIMTHSHTQPKSVGNVRLQVVFPDPRAGTVAAATIGFNQQLGRQWIAAAPLSGTPVRNVVDRKPGRIGRLPHIDGSAIRLQIINAVWHRPSQRIVRKIVGVDQLRLLDIRPQPIAIGAQQPTDDRLADPMAVLIQLILNIDQAAVEPFVIRHRIARRVGRDTGQNQRFKERIFFSAAGRPAPPRRWRVGNPAGPAAATSRRPRRMVFGFKVVIWANSRSDRLLGWRDNIPTNQRRWASLSRLNTVLICWCQRALSESALVWQCEHAQRWIAGSIVPDMRWPPL